MKFLKRKYDSEVLIINEVFLVLRVYKIRKGFIITDKAFVPTTGVEPAHPIRTPGPQPSASTNSATWVIRSAKLITFFKLKRVPVGRFLCHSKKKILFSVSF